MALKMGATLSTELSDFPPTTIIIGDPEENTETSKQSTNETPSHIVTENWLKHCFVFALNIPKSTWHEVKTLPNLERTLASLL